MTYRLLIVEDDHDLACLLQTKFESRNFEVKLAHSLVQVLDFIGSGLVFSHCLMDLNVCHQSSLVLIPKLKQVFSNIKIVVLTGYANVHVSIEAVKLGAVYLLSKPSKLEDILLAFDHVPNADEVPLDSYLKSTIDSLEQQIITQALAKNQYNVSKTARELGMHRRTLQRKIKRKV